MDAARPLRDVFADLAQNEATDEAAHSAQDVLRANGHTDLPDGLIAEAVGTYADTAPLEVAEHLSPYVMAHSCVPLPEVADVDASGWLNAMVSAPVVDGMAVDPADTLDGSDHDPAFDHDAAFDHNLGLDHNHSLDHDIGLEHDVDQNPVDHHASPVASPAHATSPDRVESLDHEPGHDTGVDEAGGLDAAIDFGHVTAVDDAGGFPDPHIDAGHHLDPGHVVSGQDAGQLDAGHDAGQVDTGYDPDGFDTLDDDPDGAGDAPDHHAF